MKLARWFSARVTTFKRSEGASAVAKAAYRSGTRLHDERTGEWADYSHRRGVIHTQIVLPRHAPEQLGDRQTLWNEAERAETRKDSRVAREMLLALPHKATDHDRLLIAQDVAKMLVDELGVGVDFALHAPHERENKLTENPLKTDQKIRLPGGSDKNFHGHFLFTTRKITAEGLGEKTRKLDMPKTSGREIDNLRQKAAEIINKHLERMGSDERVDHRSYESIGLAITPTKHIGVAGVAIAHKGQHSDRTHEWAKTRGKQLEDLAEYKKLKKQQVSSKPEKTAIESKLPNPATTPPKIKPAPQKAEKTPLETHRIAPSTPPSDSLAENIEQIVEAHTKTAWPHFLPALAEKAREQGTAQGDQFRLAGHWQKVSEPLLKAIHKDLPDWMLSKAEGLKESIKTALQWNPVKARIETNPHSTDEHYTRARNTLQNSLKLGLTNMKTGQALNGQGMNETDRQALADLNTPKASRKAARIDDQEKLRGGS